MTQFWSRVVCCKCMEFLGEASSMQESRDLTDLHRMFAHDEIGVPAWPFC